MTEKNVKNKIITLTVFAVLLVFILIGLLVFQYINYWQLTSKQLELNRQLEILQSERQALEYEVTYKESEQYVEDYAREVLGWGKDGEVYYD